MQIFTDHFYEKGHSHLVCQDYALSHANDDYAFFVVSDGCGSAPKSELGSMIMANAFKAAYENLWTDEFVIEEKLEELKKETLKRSMEVMRTLEMRPESFYATILFGCYDKRNKTFHGAAWGDGLFVLLFNDGSYEVIEIEYENNAPFYMCYDTVPSTLQSYINSCGGKSVVSDYKFMPDGTRLMKNDMFHSQPKPFTFPRLEK